MEEIRVNMKNIFSSTVPWKKDEAADRGSVGSIMCSLFSLVRKSMEEQEVAHSFTVSQVIGEMLVLVGYVRIQSTGRQDTSISEHRSMFTIHKFELNNEVLQLFASIL